MSRKLSKQIIGQSLISPIAAPPKARQSAWVPPERNMCTPPITPVEGSDSRLSFSSNDSADAMLADIEPTNEYVSLMSDHAVYGAFSNNNFSNWDPMDLPRELLPKILRFLDKKSLSRFLTTNRQWAEYIIPLLYSHHTFRKNSVKQLKGLTIHLQEYQSKNRILDIDYISFVKSLHFKGIVFSDMDRRFISWKDVSDLLRLCGSLVNELALVFDDISFINISDYDWFPNSLQFTNLKSFAMSSKNAAIPEKICIELLRRCQPQSLESVSITSCISSFSGTSWYLLHDKISPYLKEISLTPNLKSTDWDNDQFQKGVLHLAKTSGYLQKVDFSGHTFGLEDHTLSILLELGTYLKELVLPCGLNDTHLIAIMSCTNIGGLKKLDLSCKCPNGRFTDVKKECWPCSRFTDSVLIALMEKAMADNYELRKVAEVNRKGYEKLEIVLPRFLMEVKTGKKIQTLHWAAQFRGFIYDFKDKEAIFYKGFRLYAPGARFI